jgi:hypothetical protein
MLTNFLEHTLCPEAMVEPFLERPVGKALSPIKTPPEAQAILAALQRDASTERVSPDLISQIDQAINILRLEKYLPNSGPSEGRHGLKYLVRQVYYLMRPLFPVSFRKHLQRLALKDWDSIPFPAWPVDLTIENLMETIWESLLRSQDLKEIPFIWFWPDGHSCACMMTHDVETEAGRAFCTTMMQMEKKHGISSAFEVVPEQRYVVTDRYLDDIRGGGCEVCIHGLNHDGHDFSSETIFFERAKKINMYAKNWGALGFRSPVLYRNLDWLHALQFSYDMSVPNVGHLDAQRGGCCTVMPYFIGDILELPLTTIQDYSLFNILEQRSLDLWMKQIAMIREKHGLISFIIHPDYVNESWSSDVYDRLLGRLVELHEEHHAWLALPKEIDGWWRARRQMRLIRENREWKILGPQADRAQVAYAFRDNGVIAYRITRNGDKK